jgi:stage V sporulation protein G
VFAFIEKGGNYMVVTEVKIKLVPKSESKLLAFACITLDRSFVVRDIKIIQGNKALFVAMPSRKITDHCRKCGGKNHLQAQYCNECGDKLSDKRSRPDNRGRAKLHADIAHPINARCRQDIQEAILQGYQDEFERSRQPGYVAPSFDEFDAGPEDDESESPSGGTIRTKPGSGIIPPTPMAAKNEEPDPLPPSGTSQKQDDSGGFGILS